MYMWDRWRALLFFLLAGKVSAIQAAKTRDGRNKGVLCFVCYPGKLLGGKTNNRDVMKCVIHHGLKC